MESSFFWGEIRENNTCVFERQLLTKPVSVSFNLEKDFDLDIGTCTNVTRPHSNKAFAPSKVILLRCTNARLHCVGTERSIPWSCSGVIQKGKETFLCEDFSTRNKSVWRGICREIRNFDFKNENWFGAREINPESLYNHIAAASITQTDRRMVKVFKGNKEITHIHKAWFWLCAAKVAVVFALACAVMHAILRNAPCVVNDERCLATLLTDSVPRVSKREGDESALYLHATNIGKQTIFWASGHQLRRRFNQDIHIAERAAM